jgi:hypothetical protein
MYISTPELVGTRIAQLEREAAAERLARTATNAGRAQRRAARTPQLPQPLAGVLGRILAHGGSVRVPPAIGPRVG